MKRETGFEAIAKERIEQVNKHHYQLDNDQKCVNGELMKAAMFCITLDGKLWPRSWSKERREHIKQKSTEQRYVIAGAFMAAEVDRLRGVDDWQFELQAEKYSEWDKLKEFVHKQESELHQHYSGTLVQKACVLISRHERIAAGAIGEKMQAIEDMKIYVRAMTMAAEMVAIAGTHGEKNARLRGMIELMNSTSSKLNKGYEDELLASFRFQLYGNSDQPYQKILRKYDELKRENEELKRKLNPQPEKKEEGKELPF